jgi:hypothetical protein
MPQCRRLPEHQPRTRQRRLSLASSKGWHAIASPHRVSKSIPPFKLLGKGRRHRQPGLCRHRSICHASAVPIKPGARLPRASNRIGSHIAAAMGDAKPNEEGAFNVVPLPRGEEPAVL